MTGLSAVFTALENKSLCAKTCSIVDARFEFRKDPVQGHNTCLDAPYRANTRRQQVALCRRVIGIC